MIHYTQTLAGESLEDRWVTCNGQLVRKDGEGYGGGGGGGVIQDRVHTQLDSLF